MDSLQDSLSGINSALFQHGKENYSSMNSSFNSHWDWNYMYALRITQC